ncbi:MAG: heparinase II/III family protein [Bacteroidales bacterium]|nr:heparinase II/III family protein [Bacteroidales bacterium]
MKHVSLIAVLCTLLCLSAPAYAQNPEHEAPLIGLNRSVLYRNKKAIERKDPSIMPAFNKLMADVEDIMKDQKRYSVMDKTQTPPSGDMHDYVSRGPYWWPDPSKPNGLPYIRKDGERNPEWYDFTDHTYLSKISNYVYRLGLAYYFTGEEKYAEKAVNFVKVWFLNPETKMNPNLNYAQQIPGVCDGRGIGLIDTPCMIDMLEGLLLMDNAKAWTEEDKAALKTWFKTFLDWMRNSENGKDEEKQHNNHGTYYDMQVVAYAVYTGQTSLAKKQLETKTKARLESQLAPDGEQPFEMARTKPWGYCGMNIAGFVRLATLGEKIGVNLWKYETKKGASIRKAIEWYFPYLEGKKEWPKAEISGKRDAGNMVRTLMMAAGPLYSKAEYEKQIQNVIAFTGGNFDLNSSIYQLTFPIIHGTVLSDAEFFESLNLNYPGLLAVKEDVAAGDLEKAKKDFVAYLRARPVNFDWRDADNANAKKDYNEAEVEKVVANNLIACGIRNQFGETVDWMANPTELQYCEWTWQLGRHPYWTQLGKAYKATGNEKYAKAFVNQLRSWIEQCPLPDNSAPQDFSRWRTIEAGIRTLGSWPNAFLYFLKSPSFDDESVFWMVKSFHEHAVHLRKYHRKNNWFAMEMNGLFHTAVLFPEFKESPVWAEYASSKIYQETGIQVYPDGAQVELAPGYHGVSLNNFLGIYTVAKAADYKLPKDYVERLENMYNFYAKIMMPDGSMPSVNDSGWGSAIPKLKEAYSYFPERKDFQYLATRGKEGITPDYTSVWMPWAGWYMMRSGWAEDDFYAHFEVGPFAPAHQHEDKLSIILAAYGKRLLTEAGTYAYDTSKWRKHILSATAHNNSRVDGQAQNRRAISDDKVRYSREELKNRWITTDDYDFGEGWYDEGFGKDATAAEKNVVQYRALTFLKNKYWLLIDVFTPKDNATHTYETLFHFNTDKAKPNAGVAGVQTADSEGANLAIIPLRSNLSVDVKCGQETPELMGWRSGTKTSSYGCTPIATPVFTRKEAGQIVEPYLLYPLKEGEELPIKSIKAKGNLFEIVYKNGEKESFSLELEGNKLKTLNYSSKSKKISILK